MTTQPKTTEAENPYLTREDALAILNTPDDQLDELIARAEKLRRICGAVSQRVQSARPTDHPVYLKLQEHPLW